MKPMMTTSICTLLTALAFKTSFTTATTKTDAANFKNLNDDVSMTVVDSLSSTDTQEQDTSSSAKPPKVKVLAAVESLCPGCKEFMLNELFPTYSLLGSNVIDLQVVVFGNSQIDLKAKTVECQHGVGECDANTYEQCAVNIFSPPYRYLPYLHCLDSTLDMGYHNETFDTSYFAECARASAMDFTSIQACHDNPHMAWHLQKKSFQQTPDDHQYVPWVEINGAHTFDESNDHLFDVICQTYQANGGSHPACPSNMLTKFARKIASYLM